MALKRHIRRQASSKLGIDVKAQDGRLEVTANSHRSLHELVGLRGRSLGGEASPDGDTVAAVRKLVQLDLQSGTRRADDTSYKIRLERVRRLGVIAGKGGFESLADSREHLL